MPARFRCQRQREAALAAPAFLAPGYFAAVLPNPSCAGSGALASCLAAATPKRTAQPRRPRAAGTHWDRGEGTWREESGSPDIERLCPN